MSEHKYRVGEFVFWRQQLQHYRDITEPLIRNSESKSGYVTMGSLELRRDIPARYQILEVLSQWRYGGEQLHYQLRKGDGSAFNLTEPEITNEPLNAE